MNKDQFLSFVRSALKVAGAYLVAKGIGDASAWQDITGGALAVAGLAWSHLFHSDGPSAPSGPGGLGGTLKALILAGSLALPAAWLGCSGCSSTLENGGAYAPLSGSGTNLAAASDISFYTVDLAYQLAWNSADAVFQFEYNNRPELFKVAPNFKHELDKVRPQAIAANAEYLAARAGYADKPTPAGLSQLQTLLGHLTQISQAIQALGTNQIAGVK
jgi:hypothetical protein